MIKIIGKAGTGKTRKLIAKAKVLNATIVCSNPAAILTKSRGYGFGTVKCISYEDYFAMTIKKENLSEKYLIDDLDTYIEYVSSEAILGYTLTED